ncbi:hypothetical protein Glove_216g16 [Diversispora epigaea]|uniref:Uncharacterized protein n=1 Tax=Diversispora epigaea TaxID=1348612 RepID=A0A397IM96_9GLOM|nr:hypothetical protein Glove_216g16 [Diversispora epigaea]
MVLNARMNNKKYLEARKLITYWSDVNGFYKSYTPEIGIAICFSCNQLEWRDIDLHALIVWMSNAVRRVKREREVAKKIRAINIISQKWLEYMYRPDGLCAPELAIHFKLLWGIREEMRRVSNV